MSCVYDLRFQLDVRFFRIECGLVHLVFAICYGVSKFFAVGCFFGSVTVPPQKKEKDFETKACRV